MPENKDRDFGVQLEEMLWRLSKSEIDIHELDSFVKQQPDQLDLPEETAARVRDIVDIAHLVRKNEMQAADAFMTLANRKSNRARLND